MPKAAGENNVYSFSTSGRYSCLILNGSVRQVIQVIIKVFHTVIDSLQDKIFCIAFGFLIILIDFRSGSAQRGHVKMINLGS